MRRGEQEAVRYERSRANIVLVALLESEVRDAGIRVFRYLEAARNLNLAYVVIDGSSAPNRSKAKPDE